jgi:hypothetical protein
MKEGIAHYVHKWSFEDIIRQWLLYDWRDHPRWKKALNIADFGTSIEIDVRKATRRTGVRLTLANLPTVIVHFWDERRDRTLNMADPDFFEDLEDLLNRGLY